MVGNSVAEGRRGRKLAKAMSENHPSGTSSGRPGY
jgi:hypothetical protein